MHLPNRLNPSVMEVAVAFVWWVFGHGHCGLCTTIDLSTDF